MEKFEDIDELITWIRARSGRTVSHAVKAVKLWLREINAPNEERQRIIESTRDVFKRLGFWRPKQ